MARSTITWLLKRTAKRLVLCGLVAISVVAAMVVRATTARVAVRDEEVEAARLVAESFAKHPLLRSSRVAPHGTVPPEDVEVIRFRLLPVQPSGRWETGLIEVDRERKVVTSFSAPYPRNAWQAALETRDKPLFRDMSAKLISSVGPVAFRKSLPDREYQANTPEPKYMFRYSLRDEHGFALPVWVEIGVSPVDHKVVRYVYAMLPYRQAKRVVSQRVAEQTARTYVRKRYETQYQIGQLLFGGGGYYSRAPMSDTPHLPRYAFRFTVKSRRPEKLPAGHVRYLDVLVDAETGRVVESNVGIMPQFVVARHLGETSSEDSEQPHLTDDRWPSWTGDGQRIVFESRRRRVGDGQGTYGALFIVDAEGGEPQCLGGRRQWAPLAQTPTVQVQGPWVAYGGKRLAMYNLESGKHRTLSEGERTGHEPSWSPRGDLLAFASTRRHGDQDIFVLSPESPHTHLRLGPLRGFDAHPTLISETEAVFAHSFAFAKDSRRPIWSIMLARFDYPHAKFLRATPVAEGFPLIRRISNIPGTRQVLVSHVSGLEMVDVDSRERHSLGWKTFQDDTLPRPGAVHPEQGAVSPDGKRVVFSGRVVSANPTASLPFERRYLYVCDLDGRNLRRLTGPQEELAPEYEPPRREQSPSTATNSHE